MSPNKTLLKNLRDSPVPVLWRNNDARRIIWREAKRGFWLFKRPATRVNALISRNYVWYRKPWIFHLCNELPLPSVNCTDVSSTVPEPYLVSCIVALMETFRYLELCSTCLKESLGRSKPATNLRTSTLTHCVGFLLYPSLTEPSSIE